MNNFVGFFLLFAIFVHYFVIKTTFGNLYDSHFTHEKAGVQKFLVALSHD